MRRARAEDLPRILAIEQAAFEPARRASPRSLRRSLGSARQSVWIAESAGTPAGFLILWHHPRTLRAYNVAVHPAHRGKGLASRLMRHAENLAGELGADRVVLEASKSAPGLVERYEHWGYRARCELPGFYGPGTRAVRLEKPIPQVPDR